MTRLGPPDRPPVSPPSRSTFLKIGFVILLLIAAVQSITFYVENLWFESLGFESVYWYQIKAQSLTFIAFFAATTFLLWLLFRLVIPASRGPRRAMFEVNGQEVFLPGLDNIRSLARPVAILIGIILSLGFSHEWQRFAMFLNRPEASAAVDPVFGLPIPFFLFTLPMLSLISGWLMTISVITLIAAVVLSIADRSAQFRGVSTALGLLLASLAFRTIVGRYELLLDEHRLFAGADYVARHVLVPGMMVTAIALAFGAILAWTNIVVGRIRFLIFALAIPAVIFLFAGGLIPFYVTTFIVRPNELERERPFIKSNIQFTRQAYNLDNIEEVPFDPRLTGATFNPADHGPTLDNIRLWDWRALQDTLRQIQEIRTYYDFPDVDVDRYTIDGKTVEVMLAARELSLNKLPAGSRSWVNDRLNYTHGYGVTMNAVSHFTREGLPQFILSNMPVESTKPEIQVKRPEIYYGELSDWPVYVKTRQKEFNYAGGNTNNYSTYEGSGGIRMGGLLRRLLLAYEIGDIANVPFSDDITEDSVLLMRRDINRRVSTIAPFLTFDGDPYLVVGEDGALYWIIDAYTASDRYPYSRHIDLDNRSINYLRNSVKTVVDAYNGNVSFYVFDPTDPLINAYQKMFPALFKARSEMPAFLQKHIRYPELMLKTQASMYQTYHVSDEQVFLFKEDIWTVAQQGRTQGGRGNPDNGSIEPFFVLMRFPGETNLEFVSILPFTPSKRNNLIGWLGARSDGDAYGKLRAYHLPKTKFVDGPLQIQARIDQNPDLSSQLTLWNQQGSKVIRGNLLVLPLNDTLLFAEPIYLQAERSPMPELRLVVLATQDRLGYGTTFNEALQRLLAGGSEAPTSPTPSSPTTRTAAPNTATDVRGMIDQANRALADYRRLTSEGKLGEAGAKLDELKRILEELTKRRE